jgi:hypothetical protein
MLKRILLALWLAVVTAMPAAAHSVLPLDLGQIIDGSATVFQGTAIENTTGKDPQTGMLATLTTFRVDDVLKGTASGTYTIKQIGGTDSQTKLFFRVNSVPTFKVGESYVVFLTGASTWGFSSPVGLAQGKFTIQDGEAGLEVGNGQDFRDMTANVPDLALPAQAKALAGEDKPLHRIALDDFKAMVRKHAGAKP